MNDFLLQQQQVAIKNLENRHSESRIEKRKFIEKIITFVLAILGFSLTIFSTEYFASAFDTSFALILLFLCWMGLLLTSVLGFIFLKLETDFNDGEALAKSLYANDNSNILDANLNIADGRRDDWVALMYLQGVRNSKNDFWSGDAVSSFHDNKTNLDSWNLVENPQKFYSYKHRQTLKFVEWSVYSLALVSLLLMMFSVGSALLC